MYDNIEDSCPFCDSLNFSQIDKDKMHCRDCGEKWKMDVYEDTTVQSPDTDYSY